MLAEETVRADYNRIKNLDGIETFDDWKLEFNLVDMTFQEFYIN